MKNIIKKSCVGQRITNCYLNKKIVIPAEAGIQV